MNHYSLIANLFKYPSEQLFTESKKVEKIIRENYNNEISKYMLFLKFMQDNSLSGMQEYYVNTFDVRALCHLDVGYILFGEDLKRGNFLVKLQEEHNKNNINPGTELADHLPNVLVLLSRSKDAEFVDEFVQFILLPAILSMIRGFKSENNAYHFLLQVLKEILLKDFQIDEFKIDIPVESKECVLAGNGCAVNNSENY